MGLLTDRPIGTTRIETLPLVFLDIETTGHSRQTGGEICEIGSVKADPKTLSVLGELDLQLQIKNPNNRSEAELSFNGYNGYSLTGWVYAIEPRLGIQQLNDFCAGSVVWGWNISFEFHWLSGYYEEYGLDWKGDYHWLCLMSAAFFELRQEFSSGAIPKLSLSQVSARLGLGEEPNPHRGLTGAQYELEIFKKLRNPKQSN